MRRSQYLEGALKKSEKRAGKHRTNILKIFLNDVEYRKNQRIDFYVEDKIERDIALAVQAADGKMVLAAGGSDRGCCTSVFRFFLQTDVPEWREHGTELS